MNQELFLHFQMAKAIADVAQRQSTWLACVRSSAGPPALQRKTLWLKHIKEYFLTYEHYIKDQMSEAAVMAQWLKALFALPEDLDLISSSYMEAYDHP